MPMPRPIAMGIVPTPSVDFERARLAVWGKSTELLAPSDADWWRSQLAARKNNGLQERGVVHESGEAAGQIVEMTVATAEDGWMRCSKDAAASNGHAMNVDAEEPAGPDKGKPGDGDAQTRGCYEGVPGPKRRMRIYCFRSPPGELDGWVPSSKEPRIRRATARGSKRSSSGKKEGDDKDKGGGAEGDEDNEALEGKPAEEDDDGSDDETDLRTFHPKLRVNVGRGPGEGLGHRLYVGLASAAPLPLTATQADKVGIEDSFDVELNPAQMAAIVQWHRETLGMVALYDIPHQLTRTPELDPEKCPFRNAGELGDKGVIAVPVEFIETSGGGDRGTPVIDWTAIEAANAGTQPPSDTDEEYARRILFSRVSHKTCRFYFVLERTSTTLGDYLQRCLESDLGPYAGLPCETITDHPAGRYGRVRGSLAVGHGVRKPDYDAAYKSQQLLLGVPAPALRHSFAQHLIRGEKIMDPDAGVRRRVMLSQRVDPEKPDATAGDEEGGRDAEEDAMEVDEEIAAGDEGEGAAPKPSPVKGWAGVSTLKSNRHRVGTAQPVLLVEQYTQAVCMTREVFVSVLHIVPRMFDLERQLLCFVLHEAVFLPALQASLYHRSPAPTAAGKRGDVSPKTQAVTFPEAQIDTSPGTTTDTSPGTEADASMNGQAPLVAVPAPAPAKTFVGAIDTSPDGDAAQRSGVEIGWPSNGAWNAPGRGAGTGSGPGGATSLDPDCVLARKRSAEVEAAALRAGAAAAEAAAMGVIQWQGGQEGAVVDTLALLDCSLRRPVNERLETLGDAWLNYYAGFVVFQDKPVMMEEGMMTLLRKNVVSNARLIKCADGRGLREFMYPPRSILGRPFEMWAPSLLPLPPAVKANRKTIADVVEALLGAALVAGGNRSAAFLMEWLGLPTLEASNKPDKPPTQPRQEQQHQQQQQQPPQETEVAREDSVVVENGSENPGGGVTNILPLQGTATGSPPTGAEASASAAVALKMAAAATSGSGFVGEIDGEGAGGDSQLTVSCDPMDDGGGSDNGNNGCGNGDCNGNNFGGGSGQEGVQEGNQEKSKGGRVLSMGVLEEVEGEDREEGEEGTASTTKRKEAPSGLVEAPKRIRTSEDVGSASVETPALERNTGEDEVDIGGTETPSSADTTASSALSVEGIQDASENGALGEEAPELGADAGVGPAAAAAADVIEDIINDVIANAGSSEEHEKEQDEAKEEDEVEDSGDEGNASDIARKLSADARADGGGSRRRAPLPDHGPQVGEKERPWLWNPPAYMLHENPAGCSDSGDLDGPVNGGAPKESGKTRADSCADCPADRVSTSHNDDTISTSSGQTGAGSGDMAGTAEPTEVAAMEVDEVIADEREGDSSKDRSSSSSAALEQETANERSRSPDPQQGPSTEGGSTGSNGVLAEANENGQETVENEAVQEKWKGLLLEGLKESAQWPIRRESLMSVSFLVDTGVLPKVYVTTKPSARLMGNIRRLEQKLSYTFKHPWLCMQAITHPSWTMFDRAWKHADLEGVIDGEGARDDPLVNSSPGCLGASVVGKSPTEPGTVPAQDYQRLEFLGDAVLGWLVTAHLYFASSTFTPAELTRIKASCVCNASLWFIALKLDIHNVLRASPKILGNIHAFAENRNNSKSLPGRSTPPKHPADVLEALIGAVFLDSSCCMDTVSRVFWPLMAQHLQEHPPPPAEDEVDGVVTQIKPSIPRGEPAPMDTSAPDTSGGGAGASPACAAAGSGDGVDVAGNVANGVDASAMAADDLPASDSVGVSAMAADDLPASDGVGASAMAADGDRSPASDGLSVSASADAAPSGDGHGASDSETETDDYLAKGAENEFVGVGSGRDGYGEAGAFVCHSCSAAADFGEEGTGVTPMAVDGDTLEGHSER